MADNFAIPPLVKPVVQFAIVTLWVTALITSVGAILGAAIWLLVGLWTGSDEPLWSLALAGVRNLGFYCFIWAPGTGIVIATIREHRRRRPSA